MFLNHMELDLSTSPGFDRAPEYTQVRLSPPNPALFVTKTPFWSGCWLHRCCCLARFALPLPMPNVPISFKAQIKSCQHEAHSYGAPVYLSNTLCRDQTAKLSNWFFSWYFPLTVITFTWFSTWNLETLDLLCGCFTSHSARWSPKSLLPSHVHNFDSPNRW